MTTARVQRRLGQRSRMSPERARVFRRLLAGLKWDRDEVAVGCSRGGGGARAFSLGGVCQAGHKVPCRWHERTLGESRERGGPLSAAPSSGRGTSGDPVGSVSPLLPADGERCADGAG